MFIISNYKKILTTSLLGLFFIASLLPVNKVEARGEGAVALAAGVGALMGAAIASDVHHTRHHKRVYRQQNRYALQQETMNYVLMNYNPAFHDAWVRYIIVDCGCLLSPVQQHQLLNTLNQRRTELGYPTPISNKVGCYY